MGCGSSGGAADVSCELVDAVVDAPEALRRAGGARCQCCLDRVKDIVISGGESIASVEIEQILLRHPSVLEVAVVGRPDDQWGEVPVAFVTPKPGVRADADTLIASVREQVPGFEVPKAIFFRELPKTSTGKIE